MWNETTKGPQYFIADKKKTPSEERFGKTNRALTRGETKGEDRDKGRLRSSKGFFRPSARN